jgi:steroid 5-alpha reductase family enzyme
MKGRLRAFTVVILAYILALAVALLLLRLSQVWSWPPLAALALADGAATLVVFLFSVVTNNSSLYDPYWSVAPLPIALFWLLQPGADGLVNPRHLLIFTLVCLWAVRLTFNWASRWQGLAHEDWRYQDIRRQTGRWYWPVSFLGIHLMPTVLVFLGCLALWPNLSDHGTPLGILDLLATLVTLAAILCETIADLQMERFRRLPADERGSWPPGLWRFSRHPNYFGEVLFWWGLYLFVLSAHPTFWWTIVGPLAILLLFVGISIPLMERHLLARYPTYVEYQRRISPFIPWPPR